MANLSPANEARLRAEISKRGLQEMEELLVASAVECATLCTVGPDDYAQTGNSRYCGVPDLPHESLWPQTPYGTFYDFMMQINLADVPQEIAGNVLPRRGMLYCFMAEHDDAVLVWADVEPSALKRMEENPEEQLSGWGGGTLPPWKIEARAGINVPEWYSAAYGAIEEKLFELPDDAAGYTARDRYEDLMFTMQNRADINKRSGKLLGLPAYIGYDPDEEDEEPPTDTLLWMLDTDRDVGITFADAGYVQIFIERDALAAHDFSDVAARMESS